MSKSYGHLEARWQFAAAQAEKAMNAADRKYWVGLADKALVAIADAKTRDFHEARAAKQQLRQAIAA